MILAPNSHDTLIEIKGCDAERFTRLVDLYKHLQLAIDEMSQLGHGYTSEIDTIVVLKATVQHDITDFLIDPTTYLREVPIAP